MKLWFDVNEEESGYPYQLGDVEKDGILVTSG